MEREQVLSYWQYCLTDTLRINMDTKQTKHIAFPMQEYKNGKLSNETFIKSKQELKRDVANNIECVIAPLVLKPNQRSYNENRFVFPILIPVILDIESLEIHFNPTQQPWIPRSILEPQYSSFNDTFGTVFDYENFLTNKGLLESDDWSKITQYIDELDKNVLYYTNTNYVVGNESYLFFDVQNNQYSTKTILNFYSRMIKEKPSVPLFDNYISLKENALNTIHNNQYVLSKRHLGQMSDEHPLSPSQRESLHNFMTNSKGDILAVNGPPGTGKTTLLQSIIATKFVESVLNDSQSPPVIFVSSTNNQAVTNVIDSFGKTTELVNVKEKKGLEGRWIPEVDSYGLYCPSKTKYKNLIKEGSPFHLKSPDGDGFFKNFNQSSLFEKEKEFLIRFENYSGLTNQSIEKAAEWLKQKVKDTTSNLCAIIALIEKIQKIEEQLIIINDDKRVKRKKLTFIRKMLTPFDFLNKRIKYYKIHIYKKKLNKIHKYIESYKPDEDKDLLNHLDKYQRYIAFKLSIHYWEAMYIINHKKGVNEQNLLQEWRNSAQLFPCHVCTLYTLPNLFSKAKGETYYNAIDLLIIDEAGQVSPEVGGPAFALSKSALVVGDEVQIEPVWNLPHPIDQANMVRSNLAKKETLQYDYDKYKHLGISTTGSSLIKTAQKASQFKKMDDLRGMFLSEHRRCQDEIIQYCNDLAYHGKLEPMAEKKRDYPFLPYVGYAHISGTEVKKGGSRCNFVEANVISNWIKENEERITEVSGKSIEETLAVITPFTQQKIEIKKSLDNKYKDLTVGTVHSLQGAERDIVIFSSVYCSNSSYFFDAGINMLNVAMSRAKQSFLVFGNMMIFNEEGNKPSNLLARYLFSSEENELLGIAPPSRISSNKELERLSTHEDHDRLMLEALNKAKHKVSITSPYIRAAASDPILLDAIRQAVNRGITVKIFTNKNFNYSKGKPIISSNEGIKDLKATKAEIIFLHNIHNKSLWVDNSLLVEGSFNWLSAVRNKDNEHHNYESSIVYRGEKTSQFIEEIEKELILNLNYDHVIKC